MSYNLDKSSHAVFSLRYHLILVTKYRKNIFNNKEIINYMKESVRRISKNYDIEIISQETDSDHIHILFKTKPKTDLVKWINALKGGTGKGIRSQFPEVKDLLHKNTFWSPSYFLATSGEVTLSQLKNYVESQDK